MSGLLRLPPAIITAAFVATLLASFYLEATNLGAGLGSAAMWLCGALLLAWAYALYAECSAGQELPMPKWLLGGHLPFAIAAVAMTAVAVSGGRLPSPISNGLAGVGMVAILCSFWMAASALVRAEGGDDPHANRKVIVFLLLFYLPIGVWFLQPRIRGLAS